jgi:hypothetical protein
MCSAFICFIISQLCLQRGGQSMSEATPERVTPHEITSQSIRDMAAMCCLLEVQLLLSGVAFSQISVHKPI